MAETRPGAAAALPPGAVLGVLGGGQLGRMFVHAAQRLGYRTAVFDPDPASPAGTVAHLHETAAFDDAEALDRFAAACDAVTLEFENVPISAVQRVARHRPVAPSAEALGLCQHRALEKARFRRSGVACVAHFALEHPRDLAAVPDALLPGILKTSRMGYDGKGQIRVDDRAALAAAWASLGHVACVLEERVSLVAELSVVVARGADGNMVDLPVFANQHLNGILAITQVPAPGHSALHQQAVAAARALAASMSYVGVLCVEFFVLSDGRLLANEMAPRPHNSGHATLEATDLSQFDLQVRTLAGLPLTAPRLVQPAVMLNLLGDAWWRDPEAGSPCEPDWASVLALPGIHLHLYGKAEARPGRKMGHLTVTAATPDEALAQAAVAARMLGIAGPAPAGG